MMTLKFIFLFCLGLISFSASAEKAIVIDGQTLGEQSAAPKATNQSPSQVTEPQITTTELPDGDRSRILSSDKVSPRQRAEMMKAELFVSNEQSGNTFLVANRSKPGVISLASGVQYKILRPSKGRKPSESSLVVCRYRGSLIDGTDFDKSDARKPMTLKVAGLLPGLKEAVLLMPTGSRWEIVVPPQLAYGERGNQGVGPNAVLIYEMEILSIK